MDQQFPAEEYAGPAVIAHRPVVEPVETTPTSRSEVSTGSTTVSVEVEVTLRGHFEPLDGRFHWYGRLAADEALRRWQPGTTVVLTTPGGTATGRLSDLDPWGRFRISGTGRPPF